MHEFTLFNKIGFDKVSHGRISQLISMFVFTLGLCVTSISVVHAEQYCKSVDSSGSVSYTLAPETGCNKKKFKTVSVSRHITPPSPTANTVVNSAANSTVAKAEAAAATVSIGTAQPTNPTVDKTPSTSAVLEAPKLEGAPPAK